MAAQAGITVTSPQTDAKKAEVLARKNGMAVDQYLATLIHKVLDQELSGAA